MKWGGFVTGAVVAGVFAWWMRPAPQSWRGWVYPDRSALVRHIEIGAFPSAEACRAAARSVLEELARARVGDTGALPDGSAGTFECGRDCEPRGELNVCQETVD